MLDTKVLAAALVSLAATSIAVNGGASMSMNEGLNFGEVSDIELSPQSLGAFTGLVDRPEPDTPVEAELSFNNSLPQEIKLRSASITADNMTSIQTGRSKIESESPVTVYGFEGTLTLDKTVGIKGDAKGVVSNGVNVSEEFDIDQRVGTYSLKLENVRGTGLKMENVKGKINSGTTSAEVSGGQLSITSFQGDLSFDLKKSEMKMKGEVASLDAGSFSLG